MKNHAYMKKIICVLALAAAACFGERRADALDIHARNDFDKQLEIVVVYYDDDASSWTTRGWYRVEPKQSMILKSDTSKRDVYIYAQLAGGKTTWGKGDITRVIVSETFTYGDAEECPAGANRRSVKFTKFTAKDGVVNFRPVLDSQPLANAGGSSAPAPDAGGGKPGSADPNARKFIELTNNERRAAGIALLRTDENLMKAAAQRASELAKKDSGTRPDGRASHTAISDLGLKPDGSAEIRATSGTDNALEMNRHFLRSSEYREKMLRTSYTRVGVGIYRDGKKYFWVQIFAGEETTSNTAKDLNDSIEKLQKSLQKLKDLYK